MTTSTTPAPAPAPATRTRPRTPPTAAPWDGGWIATPEQILRDYRMWTESEANGDYEGFAEDAGKSADSEGKWFHEAWIPLTHDFGGNHMCLDTRSGRYVDMDHRPGIRRGA